MSYRPRAKWLIPRIEARRSLEAENNGRPTDFRQLIASSGARRRSLGRESSMKLRMTAVLVASIAGGFLWAGTAVAQQITGTPGTPSATTTIDGKQLPPTPPKLGDLI